MTASLHEEILDDLPSLLAGELPPARERAVADHLDACDPCRRDLALVARASASLRDAARLQDAAPEPTVDELPPLSLPRRSWSLVPARRSIRSTDGPLRTRVLAAAAAIVLLAAGITGGVFLGRASDGSRSDRSVVALHPVTGGVAVGSAVGEARLASSGGMALDVHGLPSTPGDDFYEVWLFDPPSGRMLAVGVLPASGKGSYTLPKEAEHGYSAVEISLEPNDGNPQHSKLSVLRGVMT